MDFPPRAGPCLFFRILFASVPSERADRNERSSSREGLSSSSHVCGFGSAAVLVCADVAVGRLEQSYADGNLLDRADCCGHSSFESVAARNAARLLRVLSVLCGGGAGFLRIPIGWNAPRGGFHLATFCT